MPDLDDILNLRTCAIYPFADDSAAIIPRIYGDFLSTLVIPADNDDGGFLPTVQIDRNAWVFALNDAPIPASPAPVIYANETPQNPLVYSFVPNGDYGGVGHAIAYIQFNTNPGTRTITWRGYGTAIGVELIQNPLTALYNAFSTYNGWTADDFNLAISLETFRILEGSSQFRWTFGAHKSIREWLTEICKCYFVNFWSDSDGKLALKLDKSIYGLPVTVLNTIDADTDLEGTSDDVEFSVNGEDIVNTLTLKWRLKWTTLDYTDEPTVDHRPSVGLYGRLPAEIELPAMYTSAHALIWLQAFFARYSYLPATVRFTVRGLGYASALPGTELGFIWPWVGWTQARLLLVLEQEVDPFGQSISFTCFDCGRFVTDQVTLPTTPPLPETRRRVRVPSPSIDLMPPAAASNLVSEGSYRRIVLRWTTPSDRDYDHTEIWASTINNRATAVFSRNGGVGAPPGSRCEETFEALEGTIWYIWLMTVDKSDNGANGGTGPTGGNWYPSSPTGGIPATAALVPTQGIEDTAVTQAYVGTGAGGTFIGPVSLAFVISPSTPQPGYFEFVGEAVIQLSALCTLVLEIREGSLTGPLWGSVVVPNILTSTIHYQFLVKGQTFAPNYPAAYGIVAQAITQGAAQAAYLVTGTPYIAIIHHKK